MVTPKQLWNSGTIQGISKTVKSSDSYALWVAMS